MSFRVLVQDDRTIKALGHFVSVTDGRNVVNSISDEQNRVVGCCIELAGVWPSGSSMPLCGQYVITTREE